MSLLNRGLRLAVAGSFLAVCQPALSAQEDAPITVADLCEEAFRWIGEDLVAVSANCPGSNPGAFDREAFVISQVMQAYRRQSQQSPEILPPPPIASRRLIEQLAIRDPESGRLRDTLLNWPPLDRLPNPWTFRDRAYRVPESLKARVRAVLDGIRESRMYDLRPSAESWSADQPYIFDGDHTARYVCTFDLSDPEVLGGVSLGDVADQLEGKRLTKLWAECAVDVTSEWVPVREPRRWISAIAVEAADGLYLISREVQVEHGGGGTVDQFDNRVFDLTGCRRLEICYNALVTTFQQELARAFAAAPLSASAESRNRPPGQLRFMRNFERSLVLAGFRGPYFELSTYSLFYWPGPSGGFLGGTHAQAQFFGQTDRSFREHVFLQMSQGLQLAVGRNGSYVEPTQQQYSAYNAAARRAVLAAVQRTTAKLRGRMNNGVGHLSN